MKYRELENALGPVPVKEPPQRLLPGKVALDDPDDGDDVLFQCARNARL